MRVCVRCVFTDVCALCVRCVKCWRACVRGDLCVCACTVRARVNVCVCACGTCLRMYAHVRLRVHECDRLINVSAWLYASSARACEV